MPNPLITPSPESGRQLRVVTLNLWGENAPLEQRLALCVEQLKALSPDVVTLQEVRQVPDKVANTAETLARELDMQYVFEKTVEWGGGDEGLAILSRLPVRQSGFTRLPHPMPDDQRIVLWAVVDSGVGGVAIFTTHLTYRMHHGDKREAQVVAVDATVQSVMAAQTERPVTSVVTGDFNACPDADEIRFMRGMHSLNNRRTYYQDAFLVQPNRPSLALGEPGITWARRNSYTHKLRFLETDRRIDYIFVGAASRDGRGMVHDCRVVLDEPTAEGVFPSDHFGVFAEIQLTPIV